MQASEIKNAKMKNSACGELMAAGFSFGEKWRWGVGPISQCEKGVDQVHTNYIV